MLKNTISRSAIFFLLFVMMLALSACGGGTTSAAATAAAMPTSEQPVSYAEDVAPILKNACYKCHGGEETSRGLSVASYDTLMKGSKYGPVIKAGDPDGSKFFQLIASGKMPKRGPKLTAEQIQIIRQWIQEGAQNN